MNQSSSLHNLSLLLRRVETKLEAYPYLLILVTSIATFLLYFETLIREPGWGDSSELSLVAYQLGLSHPPGYPLHSILGKLFSLIINDPATATNLLSAVFTCLTVGILSLIVFELTSMILPALVTSLIFATLPNIWDMAVVAEVYNVNVFFVACSILFFLRAGHGDHNQEKYFLGSAIVFGLSLGTYKANLLLLPAFLLSIVLQNPRRAVWGLVFKFGSIVGVFFSVFVAYAVIRSHQAFAINYPLNTLSEIVAYNTGAHLRPTYPTDAAFYLNRTIDHARFFARNFLYLPMLFGVSGTASLLRSKRNAGFLLLFAFAINFLYFSYYAVTDYFTMPTPSYLIFCIWVGCGIASLTGKTSKGIVGWVSAGLCLLLVVVQVRQQLPVRLETARTSPISNLILPALESFPENAVVISRWERYTPMLYFQQVKKVRADLTLVVSYDYLNQIADLSSQGSQRSILIDNNDDLLREKYVIQRYYKRWFLIVAPK